MSGGGRRAGRARRPGAHMTALAALLRRWRREETNILAHYRHALTHHGASTPPTAAAIPRGRMALGLKPRRDNGAPYVHRTPARPHSARDVPARLWRREQPMTTRAARAAQAPPAVICASEDSLRTDDQREDARQGRRPVAGQEYFTSARADEARAPRASARPHADRTPSVSVAARGRQRGEPEKADTSRGIVSVRVFLVGREPDVRAMVMS